MPDALRLVAPDGHARPLLEVHAAGRRVVEIVCATERQTDVVQIEKWLRAESLVGQAARQTVKPLLHGFVVGVLHEDSEQLKRVALIPRSSSLRFVDDVELAPAPAVLV